jgi:hypothetical protein
MRTGISKIFFTFLLVGLPLTAQALDPSKAHGISRYERWYEQQEKKVSAPAAQTTEQKNLDYLKSKLGQNKKLGEKEKDELIRLFSSQHKEGVSFLDQQFRDSVAFFEKTANDSKLTFKEKKETISQYLRNKFRERKEYFKQHHVQVKGKLKEIHSQAKK